LDQPQCRRFLGREPFATDAEMKAWFDVLAERTIRLVATMADVPVGIGVLVRDAGSRAHVGSLTLFVHDRFQRLGIGSSVLRVLMASGGVYRLQRLELSVVCDNEAALKLYHKSGFRIEGRLAGAFRYGGRFHDAYVMSLLGHELAAGRATNRQRGPNADSANIARFSTRSSNRTDSCSAALLPCPAGEPLRPENRAGDARAGSGRQRRKSLAP
jgi:putative acetyltransferase